MLDSLSPEQRVKPRRFELRISLLFAAIFIPNGIHLPFFPLWLGDTGFGPSEIAVILSLPMILRFLAGPAVSALADRAPDRVPVLLASAALSTVACAGYFLPPSYSIVLGVSLILALAWAPQTPLVDSIAQSGVRRFQADYARMRIWGSIAFLAANVVGGLILTWYGVGIVPLMLLAGLGSVVLAALATPRLGQPRKAGLSPAEALEAAFALRQPYFLAIILASGFAQASHAFIYAFGSIYWRSLGISETAIGLLWAFSVVAEVVMFTVFRRLFRGMRAALVLALASAIGMLRWFVYPFVGPLGLDLAGFFAVQALHAFSFSLAFLATQRVFSESVPEQRMGAAQGAGFFVNGALIAAFTLASGALFEAIGAGGFFVMSALSGIGALLALAGFALSPERRRGR
jgi:MFS transporter, PPP family, 3-phenylpropionic acid transporter